MTATVQNRRDFLNALVSGAAGLTITYAARGQAPAPPPMTATKLTERLALVAGNGGNIAAVISPDGLMMVDGGYDNRAEELSRNIAEHVDAHKVRILFDTHFHLDHVGSNEFLGRAGAKIIAHENVKKRLAVKTVSEALGRTFEPLKPEGLPTETFAKGGKLTFGKERIEYAWIPNVHTDGDAYIFFTGANVLHTGDMLFNGTYPVIDYSTGGWLGGMASVCDTFLKLGDAKTRIIPGHGPLATKEDVKATRDMLHTVQSRLEPMAKQGRSMEEAIAAAPTKDLDEKWGKARAESFLKMAYGSLLHKPNLKSA
jgi:glyoxylase-like metal-dependent hydrolase (beta-lactamase superfamily II)